MNRLESNITKYEDHLKSVVIGFYENYYCGERLQMYSYLDTEFQRDVPLNFFLIHSDYYMDLGKLIHIDSVEIQREKKIALIEGVIEVGKKRKEVVFVLKSDFGGWKLDGDVIFHMK